MEIYADEMFFVNFVFSYMLLYVLGRCICKVKISKKRLVLASTFGGVMSVVIFTIELSLYVSVFVRVITALMMIILAYFQRGQKTGKQLCWFFILSGIMVFAEFAFVSLMSNETEVLISNGILYFDINPILFAVSLFFSSCVMIFFVKMIKSRKNKKYYILNITHNDRTISVSALFDSGNLLKEPITGKSVTVLEWEEARRLFDINCELSEIFDYSDKLKLWAVPFNSLGNPCGIMPAFVADEISIPEERKAVTGAFVGLYGEKLSSDNEYHALINAGLL